MKTASLQPQTKRKLLHRSLKNLIARPEAWGESNPCFSSQVLAGDERSVTLVQEFYYKCDDRLRKDWYRFINSNGIPIKMATQWVSVSRCGTYSTVWLNTQHPSADQGIITCEVLPSQKFTTSMFRDISRGNDKTGYILKKPLEANERLKRCVEQKYKEPANGQFDDCTKRT
ncbi:hypothetical protein ACROYT_G001303 [Oculina patagonica]